MPSAIKYIPPTDYERNGFNSVVAEERRIRKDKYETALAYYLGEHEAPLPPDPDDPDYDPAIDISTVNLVKMTADRTVSFLFPETPLLQTEPESVDPTPEEKWLEKEFIPQNGGLEMFSKMGLRGFLAGHLFVWLKHTKGVPKVVTLHPLSVTVFWSADDTADILWYEMRFIAQGRAYIRDFVKQDDGTWKIYLYEGLSQYRTREQIVVDQITAMGNSFAEISLDDLQFGAGFTLIKGIRHNNEIPPILDTSHLTHPDDFYGLGEFNQKDLQDMINQVMSLRNRVVRENINPVDVVNGDIGDVEKRGDMVVIPENSKVTRLAMNGDLVAINTVINDLIEKYLAVARVVLLKGEAKDLQRVTNAAVRTLFLDALAKNSLLRSTYGRLISRICKLALIFAYSNKLIEKNPKDLEVTVGFASPLPTDLSEVANVNALALNGGYMSKYTAGVQLGLKPAFENVKIAEEYKESKQKMEEEQAILNQNQENQEMGIDTDEKP